MTRILRASLVALAALTTGCGTNLARYGHSRALDLMDSFPVSGAAGLGLLAQVRATPLVGLGIGYANTTRAGTDEHRFGPVWTEKERGFPIVSYYRVQIYDGREERWSGGDPKWWSETYRARASSWIVLPGFPREGDVLIPLPGALEPTTTDLWTFEPWIPFANAYHHHVQWHWPTYSWTNLLNVEAGVVAGPVGVRLGVSVIQLLDFVGGLFLIDFALDDVRIYPVLWPDPDSASSFPSDAPKFGESPPKAEKPGPPKTDPATPPAPEGGGSR